jgi:NAD(P)-dependent dehydrogenase (short-subunit alcohol dehydrogenase family)
MATEAVVIVTGASRGVGAWVARWLAKTGAGVTLVARSGDALEKIAKDVARFGGHPITVAADVADPGACAAVVQAAQDRFGRIDALVNNAAVFEPMACVAGAEPDAWHYNIRVNLLGPFLLSHHALPHFREQGGRIVNLSSGAAHVAIQAGSAYCAAKAGLEHFTRVLASEEQAVTVVALRPGVVDTDMQAFLRREGPSRMPGAQAAFYHNLEKEGRLAHPSLPARSVAWLALYAPSVWSGRCLEYDDAEIFEPALDVFGERL